MAGRTWGRVVGVVATGLALVANFAFVPVYPFWSLLLIVMNVLVIYALIVHGDEVAE